jgi:hypothetical protein
VDPGEAVSREPSARDEQLARLIARSAAERREIGEQFEPIRRVDTGLEWLAGQKTQLPTIALGAGLGLSALMLALGGGRSSVVRGGIALFRLAGSVKRLVSRSRGTAGATDRDPS